MAKRLVNTILGHFSCHIYAFLLPGPKHLWQLVEQTPAEETTLSARENKLSRALKWGASDLLSMVNWYTAPAKWVAKLFLRSQSGEAISMWGSLITHQI